MKRVAIFGNAGGGNSTLARELACLKGISCKEILSASVLKLMASHSAMQNAGCNPRSSGRPRINATGDPSRAGSFPGRRQSMAAKSNVQ
jgi:hypothetical protein